MGPQLVETRHYLHSRPELSDHEERTSAFVAERLRRLGLEPSVNVGGHGVTAQIQAGASSEPPPVLALRADMDALPIQEEGDLPYRSQTPGVMHACGHDGHTAILLGVAEILTALCDRLPCTVRLIFQPAEETVGGARRMCEAGSMDGVSAIVSLHGWVHLPLGHIGVKAGPAMAAADTFDITVQGRGAHAAYPHLAVDPIVIASRIVLTLQSAVSRETDPLEPAVVTVARFDAGTAYNIIPAEARIAGTVRTLDSGIRTAMQSAITRIAEGECAAAGATCRVTYTRGTPPVVNDAGIVQLVCAAAQATVGADAVSDLLKPSMGAEDFAYYLERAPGAMFRLGLGNGAPGHTSRFDFDDRALTVGVETFCRLCLAGLTPLPGLGASEAPSS